MTIFEKNLARASFTFKRDWTYPSKSRNLYIAGLGIFINPQRMSKGNRKIAKNVLVFDLPAVLTCPNCGQCKRKCYALKAQRLYKESHDFRLINLWLALHDPDLLFDLIDQQISRSKTIEFVRIHSSGDFFAKSYADRWIAMTEKHKNLKFYFYSKSQFAPVGTENLHYVSSILPDGEINFGSRAYIAEKAEKFGIKICPYGIDEHKDPVHCGKCKVCMKERYVLFLEH